MMHEEEKIAQELAELEAEHRALDEMIEKSDQMALLSIQRMKKRKLWLKDEIARLHAYLHPDLSA